ncbi:PH domain-containing protein [Streptomyces sp. NRRL WC-3742]|uniref:PH domain-containing protein n=1 Tax=Streptomyces sp. NRRL WC-3742 TaxID=1463934 RepID=UPI000560B94B|nr:PH domain-containing protein [Streptomyces sp. NRRL WC-3742]
MNEPIYRGKDLFRPSAFVTAAALLAVEGVFAAIKLGAAGLFFVVGLTALLAFPAMYLSYRSWTSVGRAGITLNWGFGQGRTYPWHEIRWIDVRETRSRGSSSYAARIHLPAGKRRTLPGVASSGMYPNPNFGQQFQEVVQWWEHSTHPGSRIQPPRTLRDKLSPQVIGLIIGLVLALGIFVAVALASAA